MGVRSSGNGQGIKGYKREDSENRETIKALETKVIKGRHSKSERKMEEGKSRKN